MRLDRYSFGALLQACLKAPAARRRERARVHVAALLRSDLELNEYLVGACRRAVGERSFSDEMAAAGRAGLGVVGGVPSGGQHGGQPASSSGSRPPRTTRHTAVANSSTSGLASQPETGRASTAGGGGGRRGRPAASTDEDGWTTKTSGRAPHKSSPAGVRPPGALPKALPKSPIVKRKSFTVPQKSSTAVAGSSRAEGASEEGGREGGLEVKGEVRLVGVTMTRSKS